MLTVNSPKKQKSGSPEEKNGITIPKSFSEIQKLLKRCLYVPVKHVFVAVGVFNGHLVELHQLLFHQHKLNKTGRDKGTVSPELLKACNMKVLKV